MLITAFILIGISLCLFFFLMFLRNKYGRYASRFLTGMTGVLSILLLGGGLFVLYAYLSLPAVSDIGDIVSQNWLPSLQKSCLLNQKEIIAVMPFKLRHEMSKQDVETFVPSIMETVFSQYGRVVERRDTEKILAEMATQSSDLFDPQFTARVGKHLGANYVLIGEIAREGDRINFLNLRLVNIETAEFCGKSFTLICDWKGCKSF